MSEDRFFQNLNKRQRIKLSDADRLDSRKRLAERGELWVMRKLREAGIDVAQTERNETIDLISSHGLIEVKTAQYRNGFYKFHVRRSPADYVILVCVSGRSFWSIVCPSEEIDVIGFSIRSRSPKSYRGKHKDRVNRFDLVAGAR